MSEMDEPGPPEPLVIPPGGPFRYLYNAAVAINVEHPSSNLFSALIMKYLQNATEEVVVLSETPPSHAENRRRIDHSYQMWNPDFDTLLPILIKESKAPGKKKNVEQQMYEATVQSLTYYNLTHLYGLSTVGTTFRAWKAHPDEGVRPFDQFQLEDDRGYFDIDSVDGARIWNDLMDALLRDYPRIQASVGQRSDDEPMDDAPALDPQGIPGILNPESGEGDEAGGSAQPQWAFVEVKHAALHQPGPNGYVAFEHNKQKLTLPQTSWYHDGGHWRADVHSQNIQYYCEKVRGVEPPSTPKPKGKGKGKRR
jgi:hypothetical protein